MPEISVIVPVYNVELYLHRCIDNILAQSFRDFELILVDDGSTDKSSAICDEYAQMDPKIKVIHTQNGGVSKARNIALDNVSGKYLAFCDGDDAWEKNLLRDNYEMARLHDADMVIFNYEKIWDDQPRDSRHLNSNFSAGLYEIQSGSECLRYMAEVYFKYLHGYEVWCRLIRADIVRQNNIRFCTSCNNFAEDMGFVAKCLLHTSRIFCSEQSYYKYYVRSDSLIMSKKNEIRLNEVNEISFDFKKEYMKADRMRMMQSDYPIFHYLIMFTRYQELMYTDGLRSLPVETDKIEQKDWYERETKSIDECKEELIAYFGRNAANKMVSISHYCLHKNWFRFRAENLANKVFGNFHR